MNGRCLLDTNIIIALLSGEKSVVKALREVNEVFLSSVVIGELYYGAFKSNQTSRNLRRREELAEYSVVISCDKHVSQKYGEIKNKLRAIGRPIPENDIWIAATAILHDLTLITRDRHFEEVEYLNTESW